MDFSAILFHSTNHAMWAVRILRKNDVPHKLIPVPRYLSSDCGYCIRINRPDAGQAVALLDEINVPFDRVENFGQEV